MRNYLTVFLLLYCLPFYSYKSDINNTRRVEIAISRMYQDNKYKDLLNHYSELLIAMMYQESTYNKNNKGDAGKSIGVLQIREAFINNLNTFSIQKFTYEDRYSVDKSIEMFLVYQEHYNKNNNLEVAAKIWNGGQNCDLNSKAVTTYWNSINNHMNNPICYNQGKSLIDDVKLGV